MSLSWITVTASHAGPIKIATDEEFTCFPGITSQLSSFQAVTGSLYLSTYRIIFLESPRKSEVVDSIPLKQLTIPLQRWISPMIGQPWFGPNFYEGEVNPVPGGGLQLGGGIVLKAKFIFNEGGIEKFHKALESAYNVARERHRNRNTTVDEPLPVYEDAGEGSGVPPTYA